MPECVAKLQAAGGVLPILAASFKVDRHENSRPPVLLLGATSSHAAPPADLSWLAGDWRRCKDGEIVEERWLGPRGNLMVGANLTTSPRGRTSFEHMRIVLEGAVWTFWAEPNGRTATPFVLAESGPQRVVFANPSHVFPARVSYWRDGDDLLARIEGTLKDSRRRSNGGSRRAPPPNFRASPDTIPSARAVAAPCRLPRRPCVLA